MPDTKIILRWIVLIGVFTLPFICLYISSPLFYPYIMGKNYAARIIIEIITCAWLVLALTDSNYKPRSSRLIGVFAIFVTIIGIADANGVNPSKSFWGNYERMEGWITIAHIFLYILVVSSVLQTQKLWTRLFQTTLGVSILVSIMGFFQVANIGPAGRISTTFGSPIYLSIYMLFHLFIAALLLVQIRQEQNLKHDKWLIYSYFAIIACDLLTLICTGTRGTILGLIGGCLLAIILYLCSHKTPKKINNITITAIASIVLLASLLYCARDTSFVRNIDIIHRLASISMKDDSTKARILNWGIAWQGVQERPFLGWGQENYNIVFNKYYNPHLYSQEQWFDHVHNILFDWWIAGGTFGLLAYLLIFGVIVWTLWRSSAYTRAERSILTGLVFGYFIHNLFIFDNITSYILFGTLIGYLAWREGEINNNKPIISCINLSAFPISLLSSFAMVIAGGAVYILNIPAIKQNLTLIEAIKPKRDAMQNLEDFRKAIAYDSYGTREIRDQLAQIAIQIAHYPSIPSTTKQEYLYTTINEMMRQEKISPLDVSAPLAIGMVEKTYGNYANAEIALQKAHKLAPSKQVILLELGLNAKARGKTADALQKFKEAYDLAPEFQTARLLYATEAIIAYQDELADSLLAPLIITGEAATNEIAAAYGKRKQFAKIASIWSARILTHPQDAQAYITLAAAYYSAGKIKQATDTLQMLATNIPSMAIKAQTFIDQINNAQAKT